VCGHFYYYDQCRRIETRWPPRRASSVSRRDYGFENRNARASENITERKHTEQYGKSSARGTCSDSTAKNVDRLLCENGSGKSVAEGQQKGRVSRFFGADRKRRFFPGTRGRCRRRVLDFRVRPGNEAPEPGTAQNAPEKKTPPRFTKTTAADQHATLGSSKTRTESSSKTFAHKPIQTESHQCCRIAHAAACTVSQTVGSGSIFDGS